MNTLLKTLVLAVSIIGFSSNAFAQEGESLPLKKNAISFSIIGATPAIGFVYEGLVSDNLSLELGVGWLSVGAGAKWYPKELQPGKFNFHTGLLFSVSPWFSSGDFTFEGDGFVTYIPLGFTYAGKKSLHFAIDLGPGTSTFPPDNLIFYGNLRTGLRF